MADNLAIAALIAVIAGVIIMMLGLMAQMAFECTKPILQFAQQWRIDVLNKRIQFELAEHGVSTSQLEESFLAGIGIGVWIDGEFKEIELPLQLGLRREGQLIPVPTAPEEPEGGI